MEGKEVVLAETHPFVQGLAAAWPEGKSAARHIARNGSQYLLTSQIPPAYECHALAIGHDGNGFDHGLVIGKLLRKMSKRKTDPVLTSFIADIRAIAERHNIAIHWIRPTGLVSSGGRSAPIVAMEYSRMTGNLFKELTIVHVAHDDASTQFLGSHGEQVSLIGGLRMDFSEEERLTKQNNEKGFLIDPMLVKSLDSAVLEHLLKKIRWKSEPTQNLRQQLILAGFDVPEAIESIKAGRGVVASEIRLSKDVRWMGGHNAHLLLKRMTMPHSSMDNLSGEKLNKVVEHPWFEDTWRITKIEENGPLSKVLDGDALEIHVDCDFVAEKSVFTER